MRPWQAVPKPGLPAAPDAAPPDAGPHAAAFGSAVVPRGLSGAVPRCEAGSAAERGVRVSKPSKAEPREAPRRPERRPLLAKPEMQAARVPAAPPLPPELTVCARRPAQRAALLQARSPRKRVAVRRPVRPGPRGALGRARAWAPALRSAESTAVRSSAAAPAPACAPPSLVGLRARPVPAFQARRRQSGPQAWRS
jgi:hypothetical protein